ncbi:MAG: DUF3131 domain-containing protein [Maritimibacter sp.]
MTAQRLSRRALLQMLGYGAVLEGAGWPLSASAADGEHAGPAPLVLILRDLPVTLSRDQLSAYLTPFTEMFLRVGIAIPPPARPALSPDVLTALAQMQKRSPGLVELLPDIPMPGAEADFAYALARALSAGLTGFPDQFPDMAPALPISLSARAGADADARKAPDWATASRLFGLRTVFASEATTSPTRITDQYAPIWQVQGGPVWTWQDGAVNWSAELSYGLREDPVVAVHLSLAGLDALTLADITRAAESLTGILAAYKEAGILVSLLPRELSFRSLNRDYGQSLLLLVEQNSDAEDPALDDLRAQLGPDVVFEPVSLEGPTAGALPCTPTPSPLPDYTACRAVPDGRAPGAGVLDIIGGGAAGLGGPDHTGRLRVPLAADLADAASAESWFDRLATPQGSQRDAAILLRQSALSSATARARLASSIRTLAQKSPVQFRTGSGFAQSLFSDFPLLDRLHRADHAHSLPALRPGPIAALDDAALMQDATTAFAYFANGADKNTGLSVATEFRSTSLTTLYATITQWDLASNLLAVLSAMELGLVEPSEGEAWLAKILASIPVHQIKGLTLPVAEFDYRLQDSRNRDYNASDTGRLLIALAAVARRAALRDQVKDMVAAWDLAKTVQDGRPMSISRGKWDDMSGSHYTHYIRRGYALWGVDLAPVFPAHASDDDVTRRMRLLHQARQMGLLAPEPYGLELIEIGASDEGKELSNLLVAAQYESFLSDGKLVAMTETPLDQQPWFAYQGLDLTVPGQGWRLRSNPPDKRYATDEAQARLRVFSAKAAYLTAAICPSDFASLMIRQARDETAVPERGFRVGSYSESGRVMEHYSDLNTNGIILEVLAYLARGAKPMLGADPER